METRNQEGQYAHKGMANWEKKGLLILAALAIVYLSGVFIYAKFTPAEIVAIAQPTAHADVIPELKGLSVEQLEDKLDAIVWGGESEKHVMKEGETFTTFDPPQSWPISRCLKIGGKVNPECFSNGPRQEKIPTIQGDWSAFHKEKITEQDARTCAEDNVCSKRYFLDRAELVQGGVKAWSTAKDKNGEVRTDVQMLIDLIREVKGIKI
jgi:hypothetical protein